jgi:putative transposase
MTGSRNGVVRVGDEIRLRSQVFTVVTLSGVSVRLIDAMGARTDVPLPQLLGDPSLEVLAGTRPALSSAELLQGVPDEIAEQARCGNGIWWKF